MNEAKVEFLQDALNDLEELIEFIAQDSVSAAKKMQAQVMKKIGELQQFPRRGMPAPEPKMKEAGWRMLFISPYVAFYRIIENKVLIYRIFHGASNYPMLYSQMVDKSKKSNNS